MKKIVFIGILVALFTGCSQMQDAYKESVSTVLRTEPIYNVNNKPVVTLITPVDKLTLQDIERAIIRAGATKNWTFKKIDDGKLEGSLYVGNHLAEIIVIYDKTKYNILYKDSSNLRYDNEDKLIHKNYNIWIKELQQAINAHLGAL